MGFESDSYARHAAEFDPYAVHGPMGRHASTWLDAGTVDAWRHLRMYATLDPLIAGYPDATWVTVGDGRYGKDAQYLLEHGRAATATDISDVLLREAHAAGLLRDWRQENAERLSFADDQFDFALCKESYHHFPRPMVALYEMLRVARRGIVLIEPNDPYVASGLLAGIGREAKNLANRLLGKRHIRAEYEDSGNYVFRLSRREIEKVALGLSYRAVAFRGFNDAFLQGVEKERIDARGPLWRRLRLLIGARNLLCRLGLMDYGLITAIIFKDVPSPDVVAAHEAAGFRVQILAPNPHA